MNKCSVISMMFVFLLTGCGVNGHFKVSSIEGNVGAQIHEWRKPDVSFDCDNADPPCRSSVTLGFITAGSSITAGGSPNGAGVGVDVTWGSKEE